MDRLSALDASFLAVESPRAPMHVGWVARFDAPERGPRPSDDELFEHIAGRLSHAPRFRQRLAAVPLGLHDPEWVDDARFDLRRHLRSARGEDLDSIVDAVLSTPLRRDRPLWEITIADGALVGKMHHCMVDGTAAVQLANLLLDTSPDGWRERGGAAAWTPAAAPSAPSRLARATLDRAGDTAALALTPLRLAASPRRLPATLARGARTAKRALLPPAPDSPLNRPGSADRHHVRVTRSLDEIRAVRRRFRVAPNDVLLAACAGALRRYARRRGERAQPLKAMVPADVRSSADAEGGNRISFVFLELPCDEADPVRRLRAVHRATTERERDGAAETLDAAFRTLARTPGPLQHALAHAFAHPRLFNLTVSSVPGPAPPRYLRGCRLCSIHSAVPLADRHALSIGVLTVAGKACLGITADPGTLPDADAFGRDLDAEFDGLLALAE
jgi:diacylglycerol O-acyltransferase / wax synthase